MAEVATNINTDLYILRSNASYLFGAAPVFTGLVGPGQFIAGYFVTETTQQKYRH